MLQENHAYQGVLLFYNIGIMYYNVTAKSMLFVGFSLPFVVSDERSDRPMDGSLTMLGLLKKLVQIRM